MEYVQPHWEEVYDGVCGRTGTLLPNGVTICFYNYPGFTDGICGKKAAWARRQSCFCGDHDMTFLVCDEHKKEYDEKFKKMQENTDNGK